MLRRCLRSVTTWVLWLWLLPVTTSLRIVLVGFSFFIASHHHNKDTEQVKKKKVVLDPTAVVASNGVRRSSKTLSPSSSSPSLAAATSTSSRGNFRINSFRYAAPAKSAAAAAINGFRLRRASIAGGEVMIRLPSSPGASGLAFNFPPAASPPASCPSSLATSPQGGQSPRSAGQPQLPLLAGRPLSPLSAGLPQRLRPRPRTTSEMAEADDQVMPLPVIQRKPKKWKSCGNLNNGAMAGAGAKVATAAGSLHHPAASRRPGHGKKDVGILCNGAAAGAGAASHRQVKKERMAATFTAETFLDSAEGRRRRIRFQQPQLLKHHHSHQQPQPQQLRCRHHSDPMNPIKSRLQADLLSLTSAAVAAATSQKAKSAPTLTRVGMTSFSSSSLAASPCRDANDTRFPPPPPSSPSSRSPPSSPSLALSPAKKGRTQEGKRQKQQPQRPPQQQQQQQSQQQQQQQLIYVADKGSKFLVQQQVIKSAQRGP